MKRSWNVPQGKAVSLSSEERELAAKLKKNLNEVNAKIRAYEPNLRDDVEGLGVLAHELHMSMKKNGYEPKHTKLMVRNRGFEPTSPEFYKHVHPVEDLLQFIENEHANDEPVDQTIGKSFEFKIYSRRWGHEDVITATRTAKGWTFQHMQTVETDRDARAAGKDGTGLFHLLDHDSINYPEDLPGYFEWLWERARDRGLTTDEVQKGLSELAEWVVACEKGSPKGIFEGFK